MLSVCGLSRTAPGRAVSVKTHCCGVKSPLPLEPLNRFYSMVFATHSRPVIGIHGNGRMPAGTIKLDILMLIAMIRNLPVAMVRR